MTSSMERLNKLYHHYFLENIRKLITDFNCQYQFLTINDYKWINISGLPYKQFPFFNDYLRDSLQEKTKLADDILTKGMLFPFFGCIKDNQFQVILGKHRLYSLLTKYNQEPFDKKFLFIIFPEDFLHTSQLLAIGKKMYKYEGEQLTLKKIKKNQELVTIIDKFGFFLSNEIFQFNKKNEEQIEPSSILNDENLFKQFIKQ